MPSIVDLAELSNHVYDNGSSAVTVSPPLNLAPVSSPAFSSLPKPSLLQQTNTCLLNPPTTGPASRIWTKTRYAYNPVGFYAGLYECGDQRIIAFRGTDDLLDALVDDAAVAAGAMPPQVIAAFMTVSAWGFSGKTYITGHSLGGALAILSACHYNVPAATFNAPGVADVCVQIAVTSNPLQRLLAAVSRCISNSRVRNIRIEGDPVSSVFTTGAQAGGNTQSYSGASCGFNSLCRHGMASCLAAVKASTANYQDLTL